MVVVFSGERCYMSREEINFGDNKMQIKTPVKVTVGGGEVVSVTDANGKYINFVEIKF